MRVNSLQLTDFRNYESFCGAFPEQVVIFRGANAQGKTNVLEALYLLALGKSHRTHRERELIRWQTPFSILKAEMARDGRTHRLEVVLSGKGKKVKRNGVEQRRLSDYIGTLNAVMFAPEDLAIVKGSPGMRRRFLDVAISQVKPAYVHHLSRYNQILAQRNNLLKNLRRTSGGEVLLEVLNEQLVASGVEVFLKRRHFIRKLETWAQTIQSQITNEQETLALTYRTFLAENEIEPTELADMYHEQLKKRRASERERGLTLVGPHRDDVAFAVNGIDVQTFGSQGQQRTTALSLKLAEIELIFEEIGEYPILLLDDVLSELDESRQTHLLQTIRQKVQTFVTTTSTADIHAGALKQAAIYDVESGKVRKA